MSATKEHPQLKPKHASSVRKPAAVAKLPDMTNVRMNGLEADVGYALDSRGRIIVDIVTRDWGLSRAQIAETLSYRGFSEADETIDTFLNQARIQNRLREMLEILVRITKWAGGKLQAVSWYRAQPIAAFGDRTAEQLVKSGQAAAVRDYLDHIALGGFA